MNSAHNMLRVAAIVRRSRVLGPGERFVVWVQGCPFACPACIAPDFLPSVGGKLVPIDSVLAAIRKEAGIDGVTLSGGEPMAQPMAVAELLNGIKTLGLSVVLFTGYRLEQLKSRSVDDASIARVLTSTDVLIDGLYEHGLNDSRGLRGSSNQRIHFLTDRYRSAIEDFYGKRRLEVDRDDWGEMLVGVPSLNVWRRVVLDQEPIDKIISVSDDKK